MARKDLKEYSWEEIATHNTESSCWMVLHNKVFDITSFMTKHPGGNKVLLNTAGKDGTEGFERAFHSPKARAMLQDYLIGRLSASKSASLMVMPGMGRNFQKTGYPRLQ